MALTEKQILDIERYLNYHELKQIDLRYEVLDHMANSIESSMEEGISYEDAFNAAREKWKPELKSYSSFWLGWVFVGPKMMMKRSINMVKELYLKAFFIGVFVTLILVNIFKYIPDYFFNENLDRSIGIILGIPILVSLGGLYKIRISNVKTTYQYFYKTQGSGYLILNFTLIQGLFNNKQYFGSDMEFWEMFFPVSLLVCYYYFFKIYKKHFTIVKQKLVK